MGLLFNPNLWSFLLLKKSSSRGYFYSLHGLFLLFLKLLDSESGVKIFGAPFRVFF